MSVLNKSNNDYAKLKRVYILKFSYFAQFGITPNGIKSFTWAYMSQDLRVQGHNGLLMCISSEIFTFELEYPHQGDMSKLTEFIVGDKVQWAENSRIKFGWNHSRRYFLIFCACCCMWLWAFETESYSDHSFKYLSPDCHLIVPWLNARSIPQNRR